MTLCTADGHSRSVMSSAAAELEPGPDGDHPVAMPTAMPRLDKELRALYVAHAPLVWRTLRRLGVADAQLDDAVQDVFLVVHRRWLKFEQRSSVKTWIVGIAVRVAKDYRRTQLRHARRIDQLAAALASESDLSSSPSDATERREASRLLYCLLAALPDDLRDILVLVEIEEFTVREASEALGIRLRTGQRRLHAAIEAISAAVSDYVSGERRSLP